MTQYDFISFFINQLFIIIKIIYQINDSSLFLHEFESRLIPWLNWFLLFFHCLRSFLFDYCNFLLSLLLWSLLRLFFNLFFWFLFHYLFDFFFYNYRLSYFIVTLNTFVDFFFLRLTLILSITTKALTMSKVLFWMLNRIWW